MNLLQQAVDTLGGKFMADNKIMVKCPAHADNDPSLEIKKEAGKILVHCFAGCPQNDVVQALKDQRLWPGNNGKPPSKYIAEYIYTDETGKALFKVLRTLDKSFPQLRPDGAGGWAWGVKDVRKVPYKLPDILKNQDIFICEGEKDADRLHSLGLCATTCPGGAGKWRAEYNKYFKGKNIIAIPDNDEPGREHAQTIAQNLCGVAASVKILELPDLPDKGDISDFLKNSGDKDKLLSLARSCPEWNPDTEPTSINSHRFSLLHVSRLGVKIPVWIAKDLFESDSIIEIAGDPGSGKSFVGIDLVACVGTGTEFQGRRVKQGGAVYIPGEGRNGISRRFTAWEIVNGISLKDYPIYISKGPAALCDPDSAEEVRAAIKKLPEKPVLVVIDTLARNFGPGDENSNKDMSAFISALDQIRIQYGCTIIVIHHTGHGDKTRGRGAMALKGGVDAAYIMDKDQQGVVRLTNTKMKDGPTPEPLAFRIASVDLGIVDEDGEPVTSAVLSPTSYEPPAKGTKAGRGKWQTVALEKLDQLYTQHRQNLIKGGHSPDTARVSIDDWRNTCLDAGMKKTTFHEAKNRLADLGKVIFQHGYVEQA